MSLQERTLVVRNFDPDRTTAKLLKELCIQAGPVKNVVIKPDHAFVEYEDIESVGYSRALLDGVQLFKRTLSMEPKLRAPIYNRYKKMLDDYIDHDRRRQQLAEREARQTIIQDRIESQTSMNQGLAQQLPQGHNIPSSQQYQHQINYVQQPNLSIFEANPFMIHQPYQQQQMPIHSNQQYCQPPQVIPNQQYFDQTQLYAQYPAQNMPQQQFQAQQPQNFEFRPHIPKDLARRPWSDKDRWNRRR